MLKLGEALALAEVVKPSAPGQVANSVEKSRRIRMLLWGKTTRGKVIILNDRVWRELGEDNPQVRSMRR
jgi:hypothetical protein